MKFYTFGKRTDPVIFLFPGTCCHWKRNFEKAVPLLENNFCTVCVSYDGFDETEKTVFSDMITETEKIEEYINKNFNGNIFAAYGCSLGGSFVGLLIQRKKIHIEHGFLGSSDLDQGQGISAKFQAWLVSELLYGMFQKGRLPGFMKRWVEKRTPEEREYYKNMLDMFGIGNSNMSFVRKESIRNQFYYDLVTPLEEQIFVQGTVIHCFYAVKMGEQYLKRYRLHFKDPDIRFHDMQHEELLVCCPEKWVDEIKHCCGVV